MQHLQLMYQVAAIAFTGRVPRSRSALCYVNRIPYSCGVVRRRLQGGGEPLKQLAVKPIIINPPALAEFVIVHSFQSFPCLCFCPIVCLSRNHATRLFFFFAEISGASTALHNALLSSPHQALPICLTMSPRVPENL